MEKLLEELPHKMESFERTIKFRVYGHAYNQIKRHIWKYADKYSNEKGNPSVSQFMRAAIVTQLKKDGFDINERTNNE